MTMNLQRRSVIALAAAPVFGPALAQTLPPIRLWVGTPPGGSTDTIAREIAVEMARTLGRNVIVENKSGAGGNIAADAVAKSAPDGTNLLVSFTSHTINATLYPKLPYDPGRDFAPVTLFGTSPFVLVAHPSVPANTAGELVALAKAQVGKLSYASGGSGTAMHLSGELLKSMTGSFILHVPYRGSAPAVMAVMSGETSLAVADIASIQPQLKSGRLKVIGVMGKERSTLAPTMPTLAESGIPGYDSAGWFAILAPAGTPPAIVARLNTEITGVLGQADVRELFSAAALEPLTSTPEQLGQLIRTETIKWAKVIKESGAKVD